ncbi:MAG: hypothetical protein LBT80_07645 [Lactobacillaceae bacterium]|jgi:hypothetical protein|nr:hypothetical protein [Lactobacillaceae bacterium]
MTNYGFITQDQLTKTPEWQPEAVHVKVREKIEESIARRVSLIIEEVAQFNYRTATINLHDLAEYVHDEVLGFYQTSFRKHPEWRDQLIVMDEMPLSVLNTIVQAGIDTILEASDFEFAYHSDGEVQVFWQ